MIGVVIGVGRGNDLFSDKGNLGTRPPVTERPSYGAACLSTRGGEVHVPILPTPHVSPHLRGDSRLRGLSRGLTQGALLGSDVRCGSKSGGGRGELGRCAATHPVASSRNGRRNA